MCSKIVRSSSSPKPTHTLEGPAVNRPPQKLRMVISGVGSQEFTLADRKGTSNLN